MTREMELYRVLLVVMCVICGVVVEADESSLLPSDLLPYGLDAGDVKETIGGNPPGSPVYINPIITVAGKLVNDASPVYGSDPTKLMLTIANVGFIRLIDKSVSPQMNGYYFIRYTRGASPVDNAGDIVRQHFPGKEYEDFNTTFAIHMTLTSVDEMEVAQVSVIADGVKNMTFLMCQFRNFTAPRACYATTFSGDVIVAVQPAPSDSNATIDWGNTGVKGRWLFRIDSKLILLPRGSGQCDKGVCNCSEGFTEHLCSQPVSPCRVGWTEYNGNCYYESGKAQLNYTAAQEWCETQDANLASILDESEANFVDTFVTFGFYYWIGLYNDTVSKTWEWKDGTPLSENDTRWGLGQPGDEGMCVGSLTILTGEWRSGFCKYNLRYICKQTLASTPEENTTELEVEQCFEPFDPCLFGEYSLLVNVTGNHGNYTYNCSCLPGYTGKRCEVNINDCRNESCSSHGVCQDGVNNVTCQCFPGYSGMNCELYSDPCLVDPCYYGNCSVVSPGNYSCTCDRGYQGVDCGEEIDECIGVNCNYGICIDHVNHYTCSCFPGYTNVTCDVNINDCADHTCVYGKCNDSLSTFTCDCAHGYTGSNCDVNIDECASLPCRHGGTCKDDVNKFKCTCKPGYAGVQCETDVNECSSNPCVNGDCVQGVNSYTCQRCQGFTGDRCENQIDFCVSTPCELGGTCRPVVRGYICDCRDGILGGNCENDTRPLVGTFGAWQDWSQASCSKSCDTGVKLRYRQCLRPPCHEPNYEIETCTVVGCPADALASSHSVRLVTRKSILEVIDVEMELRTVIADRLNEHCKKNAAVCCMGVISGAASFTPFMTNHSVEIAPGYPRRTYSGGVSIRVYVHATKLEFLSACEPGRPKRNTVDTDAAWKEPETSLQDEGEVKSRPVRHLNDIIHLPLLVLQEIIDVILPSINDNQKLCCFSSQPEDKEDKGSKEGMSTRNVILACVIPIGGVMIIILLFMCLLYVFRRRRSNQSDPSQLQPLDQSRPPYTWYYVPPTRSPQWRNAKPLVYK